ncbi:MAG: 50S ribosomal protein L23 [Defluviitaleaceae bacterium]|nr:50S ribosomal protein L23 [Defluviitaleaceae bacterium]
MPDLKYYDIIQKPVVTEKSMADMSDKKYVFYVHINSTKNQIREAVEKMFEGTKVERVNTMIVKGKKRRTRTSTYGRTSDRKKAIIKLTAESREIEIFQGM